MSDFSFSLEQCQIINHIQGSLLVLAPVGTGKTSVLAARVARAIDAGIDPARILCLTFTNRAAQQMRDRVAQSQPHEIVRQLTIKTFHGLCAWMLRLEAQAIGIPADFVIYDDQDSFELLKVLARIDNDQEVKQLLNAIADCKSKATPRQLTMNFPLDSGFESLESVYQNIACRYQNILSDRHVLDFADLVFYTRSMLHQLPDIAQRWRERFDFIQVDEVQDTHLGEYEIVKELAISSNNLALIGDLDQTIYEWRGSQPAVVLEHFQQDFNPQPYSLSLNYRATRTLLEAASTFAEQLGDRHTRIIPAPTCEPGEEIRVHIAPDKSQEARWIGEQIRALVSQQPDLTLNRLAVLTRGNARTQSIAIILEQMGLPCVTVEQYQFFQRQEIKDALAYLRFILDPFDTGAFKRLVTSPNRDISLDALRSMNREAKECGLCLTDLAHPQPFTNDDPLGHIITNYRDGTVIVLDTETTGVFVGDDVVEIAAIKLLQGVPVDSFRAYISDAADVGESCNIHGYSNEFLRKNGQPAHQVFTDFFQFADHGMLIGHNVGFDLKVLTAHAHKVGVVVPRWRYADTWNLAKRFIAVERYSLDYLAVHLDLTSLPSHQAMDDVLTTVQLLEHLLPLIQRKESDRISFSDRYGAQFAPLAEEIAHWQVLSQQTRPADLLAQILESSGLASHYAADPQRSQNLNRLIHIFQTKDDPSLHPDTALRSLLEFTVLAKNLDQVAEQENQVVVTTVHQAKGLEFDYVFIAGVSEDDFPNYHSKQADNIEEEKRLFYVALTRAKRGLYISCYTEDDWNNLKNPSQFFQAIFRPT
jgi:DNA helicase-2/ATP-dependent DNA helicase PcrA